MLRYELFHPRAMMARVGRDGKSGTQIRQNREGVTVSCHFYRREPQGDQSASYVLGS
jgi:hypothetical protein